MKSPAAIAAVEGSVYAATEDALKQNIEIKTGAREEYDPGQTAKFGVAGAVATPIFTKAGELAIKGIVKGAKSLDKSLKDLDKIPELTQELKANINE